MNLASNTAPVPSTTAVEGGRHPANQRMPDPLLDVVDGLAGVAFIPAPVEVLGDQPKLDDQVAGQVLRFDFAAFLPPEPDQGGFVGAHDDAGVGATNERRVVRS